MSTTPRSSGHSHNIKKNTSISLLGLLIVINYATALDYAAYRKDPIPNGTTRQSARTTREILEQLNLRNSKLIPTLQDATEHFLHYGALLRTQILDTFGKLVYDHYDDFGMSQIDALYRIYRETLERKYNIFDIVPSILVNPDTRPTKICSHINKHISTCLKESSKICMNVKIHDEPHNDDNILISALNTTRRIYRIGKIKRYYPHGFSLKCILYHLRAGRLRFTSSLFSGLVNNIQYDNFDDKVRTAERELVIFLQGSLGKLISEKLEKLEIDGKTMSHLLKNYLENGEKLFAGKIANDAAYLSRHVVREIDAVSKNIELLGTVYDNSTINLKYLFQLILPNDSVDLDIIEARDYVLNRLVKEQIIEKYLRVEKYQQTGPDQLLMEILGQLRDIDFAKNLATSLHAHARFWHKSHMIENINELLELFDAYENLRDIDEFSQLVGMIDRIKNYLRDSRNVTFELSCTRPRECLRIGLEIVAICPLINNETNRVIQLFIDRTSCDNSCLIKDSSFNNETGTSKKLGVAQDIEGTTIFSNKSDEKIVKIITTKNIENPDKNNVTLIDSTTEFLDEVTSSVTISSSNSTNYEADYDKTEMPEMENSEENIETSETENSDENIETSETENSEENTTKISQDDTETSEMENSEENTTKISQVDTETSEMENSEENTTKISQDDTETSEMENSEENTTSTSQDDTENSASILSEETTEINTIFSDSLSETKEADGNKEELTENACNGTNCIENDKCTGKNCKIECEGDDCNVTASLENCVGRRCIDKSEKTSQSSKITMENCQDSNCEENAEKVACTGKNCLKNSNKSTNDCETSNCEGNSRSIDCEGENCSESNCEDGNCEENVEKVACTGKNCLKNSNKSTNVCETSNCEGNSRSIDCEGENCSERNCEDGNCEENSESNDECDDCEENSTTINPCQGSDCSETVTSFIEDIQCRGFDCPVKNCTGQECGDEEIKNCQGSDCPDSLIDDHCEGNECQEDDGKENCEGPDCPIEGGIKCTGDDCSGEETKINCDGKDCSENICKGPDCQYNSTVNCQGSDCPEVHCTGNKCPVNDVFHECEGPDCLENLSLNSTSLIECKGPDCSMDKSKENCEGSDCSGTKSEGEETCEGSNCSDSSGGQSDCKDGDCWENDKQEEKEEEEDCEGSGCSTDENEIEAECKGDNCLGRRVEQDCKGVDCPIGEKNMKENCQGPNCLQEPFKETLIPCKGENCSITREICIDENCTTNPPTTTEEIEQNKETTTLSSTTIIVNETNRPKTFCANSDPHHKRKLHRLQKMRLIDALSSTPRSSYEIFNSFFESSAEKKRKIADKPEFKTKITNKNSVTMKNRNKTAVTRNNRREKNPVLQILGNVGDSSRRSTSKMKEIEEKIKKNDTSNSYEIDKVSKNSSNRTKLKNNFSNDFSMKKFGKNLSDGTAILSTKIMKKELKEFGGGNAGKIMTKMEIYDDENAESIGDSSFGERISHRGSVEAASSKNRMSEIYEKKEGETTRLGSKRRKLVIEGRPKKRNKNWHKELKSFQSGGSSAEGDMTKIIIYNEEDEDENGEDSSLGESTSHQGSVKLVSIKNRFPEIHEIREKQTPGSRDKKKKWIVKTSVRRSKKYQHPKLRRFHHQNDEDSRLEEIIFNQGNFTTASGKNRKSKNDETKKRKTIIKTGETRKFIIDAPMRMKKKYQHPKLTSLHHQNDEDSRLEEIIFNQGNFTTASGKNRKLINDETKKRKTIKKKGETRKFIMDAPDAKKPRTMLRNFQPGRSISGEGDMTKMIIYGEDDEDENDENSWLEEIISDEGNFTTASGKNRKSKNDEKNKRKTIKKKGERRNFIIDAPMRMKKEYQHPKLRSFQLESDEDSRLEEIISDEENVTTAWGKNRKSKNDERKKARTSEKRARQEDRSSSHRGGGKFNSIQS